MTKLLKMWEEKPEAVILITLEVVGLLVMIFFGYHAMR
jgi:hypothetical protein